MGEQHANVEIRIFGKQAEGYRVELTLNNELEFSRGYLDPGQKPPRTASPHKDGEALFEWLTADSDIKAAWAEIRGQHPKRRIRLRIDAEAPELHTVPWEQLRETADEKQARDIAASLATPFSRYLAGRWLPGNPIYRRPIRILVAMANPEDLDTKKLQAVEIDKEWTILEEATQGLDDVELTLFPGPGAACTLAGLEAELKKGYHVLHFIGHGVYNETDRMAAVYMADEENKVKRVTDQELAGMLDRQLADMDLDQEDKLRLVFLISCQSAERSPADAFLGLAPKLVASGVPAVLAMQDLVPVDTARQFTRTFYERLPTHGYVDLASNEARSAVLSASLSGAAIPVLFSRLKDCRLLGTKGRITGNREAQFFWPFLIENIAEGNCTPFLGPSVTEGLMPSRESIAEALAARYNLPLANPKDLAKVTQYISMVQQGMAGESYADQVQKLLGRNLERLHEADIHHLLAQLRLPLYVTSNPDDLMFKALDALEGTKPRRITPRWDSPDPGQRQFLLKPKPTRETPYVLHLNGHLAEPDDLILTENDFLEHFLRLSQDQTAVLPVSVLQIISASSLLFLGYRLDDWEFRVVLQGLIKHIKQTGQKMRVRVGVQLVADQVGDAEDYLRRYLKELDIDIYWGDPQQFMTELHYEMKGRIRGNGDGR